MTKVEEVIGNKYEEMDIYQTVAHICERLGWIGKDGNVSFGKTSYDYVSEAQFIASTKPLMDEAGLIVYPAHAELETESTDGNVYVNICYKFVASRYAGSGDRFLLVYTVGSGSDKDDKGAYKAMTGAFKYALRQTFRVPTGDDPEKENVVNKSFKETLDDKLQGIGLSVESEDFQQALADNGISMSDLDKPNRVTQKKVKEIFRELNND